MTRSQSEEGDSFLEILNESELGTFNCHISEICNDCANCPFESQRARPLNPSRTICGMFTRWNDSRRNSDADLCWDLMVTGPVLAFFSETDKRNVGVRSSDYPRSARHRAWHVLLSQTAGTRRCIRVVSNTFRTRAMILIHDERVGWVGTVGLVKCVNGRVGSAKENMQGRIPG